MTAPTVESPAAQAKFSLAQTRALISDLFEPKPWIYWCDFLASAMIGNLCFVLTRLVFEQPWPLGTRIAAAAAPFVISGLLFYRAAMFIHELVHLRTGTMTGFRVVWNLVCGIPFLIPSFVYYPHLDHHRRKHYGTDKDGEYLPLSHRPVRHIVYFLLQGLFVPVLAFVRFGVLTPLTWVLPGFRRWIHQRASSMVIDPAYIRPLPTKKTLRIIRLQEILCFLWLASLFVIAAVVHQRLPWPFLLHGYCLGCFVVTLNAFRTLGAHRWRNESGEMTFLEQTLDSINFPHRVWVTELWGPIGTRLHALHHLFPSLPYHALPEAHRRLMRRLPENSPYRETECISLTGALTDLWHRASESQCRRQREAARASGEVAA